jgi:UDPglucose 6-dehydrogenase
MSVRVAVVGTGYVGLVSGACLAARGNQVLCVDAKPAIVESLNRGVPHFFEPELGELLTSVRNLGNFRATTSLSEAMAVSDLVLLAVGTPSEDGKIDLGQVRIAVESVGRELQKNPRFISLVVKSTVLPGTTDTQVRKWIEDTSKLKLGEFGLGMNPEFLREGRAVHDFMHADRIVIGSEDPETRARLEALYSSWQCDKLFVRTRTAEMIKYANNSLLAIQISAINELANFAGALGGIDMLDVIQGVSLDSRWSPILEDGQRIRPDVLSYLIPGCGFGGSCFPKDVQAIRSKGIEVGCEMQMLEAVLDINARQPDQLVALWQRQEPELRGKRALVLGLAFKEQTDDVRESPARPIIRSLQQRGVLVKVHDPVAMPNALLAWPELNLEIIADWRKGIEEADAIFVITRWPEYRDLIQYADSLDLKGKVILDARRILSANDFPNSTYLTIGRRSIDVGSFAQA